MLNIGGHRQLLQILTTSKSEITVAFSFKDLVLEEGWNRIECDQM